MEFDPVRRGVAEFVGTFALIFVGAGSIAVGAGLTGAAFAHGLVIAVMASAVGHISGGHFNPAVTLGFLVTRRMALRLAAWYWLAQFAGATVAALLLKWLLPLNLGDQSKLGAPVLGPGVGSGEGLVIELILTFFLVWVIFATAADPRGAFKSIAGLAIGLTITLDVFMGGPLTGSSCICGDEPCARVRAAARPERLERRLGLVPRPGARRHRGGAALRLPVPPPARAGAGRADGDGCRGAASGRDGSVVANQSSAAAISRRSRA